MAYGVTAAGFTRKTYAVIKEEILDGIEADISVEMRAAAEDDATAINKLVCITAEREAALWELAESVYNAMYPDTADGASLRGAVTLTGTVELPATSSTVTEVLKGTVGTTIAVNSIVATSTQGDQFKTTAAITLASTVCSHAYLDLLGAAAPGNYIVTVNGTAFTYVAGGGDTEATILAGLEVLIDAGAEPVTSDDTTGELVITGDTDAGTGQPTPFGVTVSANLQIVAVGNLQAMLSVAAGPIVGLATTISAIVTATAGWTAAWNIAAAALGRNIETDAQLRERRSLSLANPGSGTVDALRAAILAVANVTAAFVLSNRTDAVDANLLPPHSFRALVLGGLDAAIAATIWAHCDAGDYIDGTGVVETITDSQGHQQTVRFNRPSEVLMWVRFTVVEDLETGTLPDNYKVQMAAYVATWGALESIGHDSSPAQVAAYVMARVPGIKQLTTEVVDNAGHPGGYVLTPWTITAAELAKYSAARVEFV